MLVLLHIDILILQQFCQNDIDVVVLSNIDILILQQFGQKYIAVVIFSNIVLLILQQFGRECQCLQNDIDSVQEDLRVLRKQSGMTKADADKALAQEKMK